MIIFQKTHIDNKKKLSKNTSQTSSKSLEKLEWERKEKGRRNGKKKWGRRNLTMILKCRIYSDDICRRYGSKFFFFKFILILNLASLLNINANYTRIIKC